MKKLLSREDRSILLACLCISFIIWLLGTLNERYETVIPVKVQYINVPQDKVLIETPQTQFELEIYATGSDLVRKAGFFTQIVDIDLTLARDETLPTSTLEKIFAKQLDIGEIRTIKPSFIKFKLDKQSTRYLPIQLTEQLQTKKGFSIKKSGITLKPDSVKVSGPASRLDSLKFWATDTLLLDNIAQQQTGKIKLQKPTNEGFKVFKNIVEYTIPVIQYTEKTDFLSIRVVNIPDDKKVLLHPKKVKLTYTISQDNYDEINISDFKIVADFANIDLDNRQEIDLEIKEHPPANLVKGIRISPNVAEFIVIE